MTAKRVKEYYLTPHLLFLDPFLKSRKNKGNINDETSSIGEESGEEEDDDREENVIASLEENLSTRSSSPTPSPSPHVNNNKSKIIKAPPSPSYNNDDGYYYRKRKVDAITLTDGNQQASKYFEKKQLLEIKNATITLNETPDPDMAFLQSVLPDIHSMNDRQKRQFKMGVLDLADKILYDTQMDRSQT